MSVYVTIKLETITCYSCQVIFGVEEDHDRRLRDTGDWFYCPNGHHQHFTESEKQRHKKEVQRLNDKIKREATSKGFWMDQAAASERSKSALKGVVTKKKNQLARVKKGLCPCCNRFFANLHGHMNNQHPDFEPMGDK